MVDFRKILDQTPADAELVANQSINKFEPTIGQVLGASIESTFQDPFTAYGLNVQREISNAKKKGSPLTKEEFKSKVGNSDIKYDPSMTLESFKLLKDYDDEKYRRDFIQSKASTTQSILGFGAGVTTGVFEPVNLLTGLGAGALFKSGVSSVLKSTGRSVLSNNKLKRALQVGAGTATIEGAITAYPTKKSYDALQQDITRADILADALIGGVIGTGLDISVTAFQSRKARKKTDQEQVKIKEDNPIDFAILDTAKKNNLDADVLHAITVTDAGDNRLNVDETTGLYGFWNNKQDKVIEYGVTPQSSLTEQVEAFGKYTADNVTTLEKALNREVNATETYLAHWLGGNEALEVLKADPNDSFAKHMKKTEYYKNENGLLNAKKFLKENGLPKTATMAEVVNTAQTKIAKGIGQSEYIPTSKDLLEKIDLKFNQGLRGKQIDLNALVATHVQRDFNNGLKFIDNFNKDRRFKLENIEKSFKDTTGENERVINQYIDFEKKIDIAEKTLLETNSQKVQSLEERLQATKDKIEKFNIDNDISPYIAPSIFEIEAEFYKTEFQDLRKIAKELNKVQQAMLSLKNFAPKKYRGYELEEFYKIFKGAKLSDNVLPPLWRVLKIDPKGELATDLKSRDITPKTAIGLFQKGGLKSADDLFVSDYKDYNLKDDGTGHADRDSLIDSIESSFGNRSIDLTQEDFIRETGLDPKAATKKDFLDYFKDEKELTNNYLLLKKSLSNAYLKDRDKFNNLKKEFDSRSQDLKRHAIQVQEKAERLYRESMKNQLDVLNKPIYDRQAIKTVDDISKALDDYDEDAELMLFEEQIKDYEARGLLSDDMKKALESVSKYDDDDFVNMEKQAITCLLTGGIGEA